LLAPILPFEEMPCYAAAMPLKPRVAIVGPGRLGSALAVELHRAGYRITEIISKNRMSSRRKAVGLARRVQAVAVSTTPILEADLVWFCVPDREIGKAARKLAHAVDWKGKITFHSSGALPSDELLPLRRRGAAVASVHPLMTFVRGSVPSLKGIPFALEGDPAALRTARNIVHDLGAEAFSISKNKKAVYHAWGGFTSPLLIALLVTAEKVAQAAGLSAADARKKMLPIIRQTLANYARLGPAEAFTGPIVRGDVQVVSKHVKELKKIPDAKEVYVALARAGLGYLPVLNRRELEKLLLSS
jgi:predicted short-subunit dehydrogenase-like oxidoreductase (DUF2520 family)